MTKNMTSIIFKLDNYGDYKNHTKKADIHSAKDLDVYIDKNNRRYRAIFVSADNAEELERKTDLFMYSQGTLCSGFAHIAPVNIWFVVDEESLLNDVTDYKADKFIPDGVFQSRYKLLT